ncbi:hypothetical protein [Microbacterium sp. MPKO10]|uniref:hypothetical protein n=1 Tax=Microbacterium sp. MPKO10 TaxID=2989818 RepID=UPI0022365724|nr:hypothetical protein [Microbacterium sp. MPKO10]MCW4457460.1 hypothetical protein [Microbacterium sp. MPKO10]
MERRRARMLWGDEQRTATIGGGTSTPSPRHPHQDPRPVTLPPRETSADLPPRKSIGPAADAGALGILGPAAEAEAPAAAASTRSREEATAAARPLA